MKKIMFNDKYGLTKAVLEGRKTQTRRFIPKEFFTLQWDERDDTLVVENEFGDFIDIRNTKFCRIKINEVVAIAQSYQQSWMENASCYHNPYFLKGLRGWTNKMFVKPELMPHQIKITNVRIERLQDISDDDCLSEGIVVNEPKIKGGVKSYYPCEYLKSCADKVGWGRVFDTPRKAYAELIDKVSGKVTWESNPYVFVYDFELIK